MNWGRVWTAVGVFATAFGLVALYLGCSVDWNTIWTALGAIATAIAVLALFLAARQLRFDAWVKAQEIFVEAEFVKARGRVLRHLGKDELAWDKTDEEAGLLVCRRMDEFCRLAPYFASSEAKGQEEVLKVWDNPLGKSWKLLAPLVDEERKKVEWNKKWSAFAYLGDKAFGRLLQQQETEKVEAIAARLDEQIRTVFKAPAPPVEQRAESECPHCAERILKKAKVCKHCSLEVSTTP